MNIIFIGPPGSGKGTMAALMVQKYDLHHLSTGDMLRENMRAGTELGKMAREYTDKGQLVPDHVIISMVESKLLDSYSNYEGVLFDGFPRTDAQALALSQITKIDAVIELEASLDLVKDRILNRMVCRKCGKVFSKYSYKADKCDFCGAELYHRSDDVSNTVDKRYAVYQSTANKIKEFYKEHNILYTVNADDTLENVFKAICKIVDTL